MKVFLGLAEVSGFYTNLKKGFDRLGVEAELVSLTPHRFGYGDDHSSVWVRFARYCVAGRIRKLRGPFVTRAAWTAMTGVSRVLLFVWAAVRFDAFVFSCASSFFRFHELPLLKLLGKRIIYSFHGTDGRPAFMDGFSENTSMPEQYRSNSGYIGYIGEGESEEERRSKLLAYGEVTATRKRNVALIDKYADVIVNSPSHGQHHTRPFVQRLIIGIPYEPDPVLLKKPVVARTNTDVVVLHSPSYPEGKGTPGIRAAVESLRRKGHSIRYVEITGRPNREVLDLITQCDFVIDQLYSDMPMVGFATEAAFFGKPAVVGGYYARKLASDISGEWIPPSLFCLPEEIEAAVEKLVVDEDYRSNLGARARAFVESKWSAERVAERFLALIEGSFPDEWLYHPSQCHYMFGMGLSKERLHRIVRGMFTEFGPSVFQIDDKPRLRQKLVEFATREHVA